MALAGSMRLSRELGIQNRHGCSNQPKIMMTKGRLHLLSITLSSHASRQDAWSLHLLNSMRGSITPVSSRCQIFLCHSFLAPGGGNEFSVLKSAALVLTRSCNALQGSPLVLQLIPAVSIVGFAAWGLGPLMRLSRNLFLNKTDSSWKKSSTYYVLIYYLQPLLIWIGAMLLCRALDPIILPSKENQAVKQRLLTFIRSLSTVMASAYCLSSLIQQVQKFFKESNDSSDARNMGFQFAGKAVYTAVWVAAVSLFMELLGFSTQKCLTAGGLGTVLLTLAGREIFTNFLSSVMIHATRPFVVDEWIQTKIEGYEVSGTVEHVGWWSPTIIRGDDREAVHIPNHKFTMNVVRNLSQKTHWRVKTHLAISHLDVNKINSIVADMRKVLAKNPQVEQQRLHRRVFLDYIDPENQALLILVSCFVKTPRFEEYLCVKEAILLDLLRVVSHHRARLATPIRTVQKVYSESDKENNPFADPIFTGSNPAPNRPLLLIEPSYKINGDDRIKASSGSASLNLEKDSKIDASSTSVPEQDDQAGAPSILHSTTDDNVAAKSSTNSKVSTTSISDPKIQNILPGGSIQNNHEKQQSNKVSTEKVREETEEGPSPEDINPGGSAFEKPSQNDPESTDGKADGPSATPFAREDGDRASISTPAFEENIVLGVALEGSKRTLPIEEGVVPFPSVMESKELAACQNGNILASSGMDKTESQIDISGS